MNTFKFNDEQLDALFTALDYIMTAEEASYEEWCDMGNDPRQHIWFYAAEAHSALEQSVEQATESLRATTQSLEHWLAVLKESKK